MDQTGCWDNTETCSPLEESITEQALGCKEETVQLMVV